jgi:hypothetical protein
MKQWLNIVGCRIPAIIEQGQARTVYGHPILNRFYGLYSMDKPLRERKNMIKHNATNRY